MSVKKRHEKCDVALQWMHDECVCFVTFLYLIFHFSYSIQGLSHDAKDDLSGVVPRFCKDLLAVAQESLELDATLSIKIALSMIEIYNEKVRDLLEKKKPATDLASLEIHETKEKRIFVEGIFLRELCGTNLLLHVSLHTWNMHFKYPSTMSCGKNPPVLLLRRTSPRLPVSPTAGRTKKLFA